jgi:lipopolysaccharide export LptBFGC system permease protein LptF
MSVILIFVVFVLIGDTAAVYISYLFERVSNFTSLMVFFALFALVFYVAWKLAVSVTERYIVRQN